MRHFKFYAETTFYLSIAEDLIKQKGVTYKFKEDDGRTNMGLKIGEYDIYVDDTIYTNQEVLDQLKDYEIIEIYKRDFDRMTDLNAEKSYSELCQKYDVIEKERDKFAERRLNEQYNEILSNTLEYYKDDIETKIKEEVNSRYTTVQAFSKVENLNFRRFFCTVNSVGYWICLEINIMTRSFIIHGSDNLVTAIDFGQKEDLAVMCIGKYICGFWEIISIETIGKAKDFDTEEKINTYLKNLI